MDLPDEPQNLGSILDDCKKALEHQVRTGKYLFYKFLKRFKQFTISFFCSKYPKLRTKHSILNNFKIQV